MAALSQHQDPRRAHPGTGLLGKASLFRPLGTVRCKGAPSFRTQLARDLACLLDVDDEVSGWSCLPAGLICDGEVHVPDLLVRRGDRHEFLDAGQGTGLASIENAAAARGCTYDFWPAARIREGFRLQNAKDLLRYARWECPLGDRVRLLAGLEENGSLTVAECLSAFRETRPIAGLATLALLRFVSIDIDSAPIGPSTSVRPWRA